MNFFKSIMSFIFGLFSKKPAALPPAEPEIVPAPREPQLMLPEESVKLLKTVENQQLKELQDAVFMLTVNVNALLLANKNEQEFLVHIATLHEELLYQLDQGKVVMIKRSGSVPPLTQEDEDAADMDVAIHKKNLN